MKQSVHTSGKETVNDSRHSLIETKQNENRLAVVIIFIAVVVLIIFGLQ